MWSSVSERHPSEPFPPSPGRLVLRTFQPPFTKTALSLSLSDPLPSTSTTAHRLQRHSSPSLLLFPRSLSRSNLPCPLSCLVCLPIQLTQTPIFLLLLRYPTSPARLFLRLLFILALSFNVNHFSQFLFGMSTPGDRPGRLFTLSSTLTRRHVSPQNFRRRRYCSRPGVSTLTRRCSFLLKTLSSFLWTPPSDLEVVVPWKFLVDATPFCLHLIPLSPLHRLRLWPICHCNPFLARYAPFRFVPLNQLCLVSVEICPASSCRFFHIATRVFQDIADLHTIFQLIHFHIHE